MSRVFAAACFLLVAACASAPAPKPDKLPPEVSRKLAEGTVVARNFCRADRIVRYGADSAGQHAACSFEEVTGTHLSSCVCRNEAQSALDQQDAQNYLRDTERSIQNTKGN
jgi:hypothetical protein